MIHCKEKLSYYTEKAQRIVLKRLVKQRKGKVSKNREDIKRKWEAGIIHQKQEVSDQNGRVGISGNFAYTTQKKHPHMNKINTGACWSARTSKPEFIAKFL